MNTVDKSESIKFTKEEVDNSINLSLVHASGESTFPWWMLQENLLFLGECFRRIYLSMVHASGESTFPHCMLQENPPFLGACFRRINQIVLKVYIFIIFAVYDTDKWPPHSSDTIQTSRHRRRID